MIIKKWLCPKDRQITIRDINEKTYIDFICNTFAFNAYKTFNNEMIFNKDKRYFFELTKDEIILYEDKIE